MRDLLVITGIDYTASPSGAQSSGLLGYLRLVLNEVVVIDGIAVRRTRDGRTVLSWPEPIVRGVRRRHVFPRNDGARVHLEREILTELRRRGELP